MIPMGVCVCDINASPTLKVIVVVGTCRDAACLEKHVRMIERCKGIQLLYSHVYGDGNVMIPQMMDFEAWTPNARRERLMVLGGIGRKSPSYAILGSTAGETEIIASVDILLDFLPKILLERKRK
jgi:hypothetical protein